MAGGTGNSDAEAPGPAEFENPQVRREFQRAWVWIGSVLLVAAVILLSQPLLLIVGGLVYLYPELSLTWQILIWAVASALFTWVWFRYFKNRSPDLTKSGLAREAILGETAQVIRLPVRSPASSSACARISAVA